MLRKEETNENNSDIRSNDDILNNLLTKYNSIAKRDPHELKNKIPPGHIWQIFVEKRVQLGGRNLKEIPPFDNIDEKRSKLSYLFTEIGEYTIQQYISFEKSKYGASNLLEKLRNYQWFLTEEQIKNFTLRDLLRLDKGLVPFEVSEPNCLIALLNAYQEIYNFNHEIDETFIKTLHKLAADGVKNTNYQKNMNSQIGEYRTSNIITFKINHTNCSKAGLLEFLNNMESKSYLSLQIEIMIPGMRSLFINQAFLKDLRNNAENFNNDMLNREAKEFWLFKYCSDDQGIIGNFKGDDIFQLKDLMAYGPSMFGGLMRKLTKTGKNISNEDIAEHIFQYSTTMGCAMVSSFTGNVQQAISIEMQKILQIYHDSIKTNNKTDQLKAIIKFHKDAAQIHPFLDLNCRAIYLLLLLHVLMRNGFPPVILENANQFEGYSCDELFTKVLEGMQNVFYLIENEELYGFKTNQMIDFLKSSEKFKPYLNYFNSLIEIEKKARAGETYEPPIYAPSFK